MILGGRVDRSWANLLGVMGSRGMRRRYCRCGTYLARDNTEGQCARCARVARDKLMAAPEVPAEFWRSEQFRAAFAAQHIGRVSRAYRTHPYHHAVYGPGGISQALLGQWVNVQQPQICRIENGPPVRDLDSLVRWARALRIPAELLWFRLPPKDPDAVTGAVDEPEADPVLTAAWGQRGTVEAVVALSGGGRVKRRVFLSLTLPMTGRSAPTSSARWPTKQPARINRPTP